MPKTRLGGFELDKPIGKGGMGAVMRARQVELDRWVALKILPSDLAKKSDYVARFRAEARAVARLDHPNIVRVLEAGEADGRYFFAMELIEGQSCAQRLKVIGPFSERDAIGIGMCVAAALSYGWNEAQLIHRDIKPDNILIRGRDGEVKVADLGLAKSVTEVAGGTSLTTPGMVVGTLHYISPEQAQGKADVDFRSDIYSLGATLYHLLAGRPPFQGDEGVGLMVKHITEPFPPLLQHRSDVSDYLCSVLDRMTAKDRNERYSSWETVLHDLHAVLEGKPPPSLDKPNWATMDSTLTARVPEQMPRVASESESKSSFLWVVGIGVLLAVTIGWMFFGNNTKPIPTPTSNSPSGPTIDLSTIPPTANVSKFDPDSLQWQAELNQGAAVPLFNGQNLLGWQNGKGWQIKDGMLVVETTVQRELERDLPLDDFELSWQMRLGDKTRATVDFRSAAGHLYTLMVESGDQFKLQKFEGDTKQLAGPAKLKRDWHSVRLVAKGSAFAIECDGTPLFSLTGAPLFGRHLNFTVVEGRAEFKDITLRKLAP